jgi:hypothetical protein
LFVTIYINYLGQGWRNFMGRVTNMTINSEKIILCAHGNFEEQNKVLESSIIIINYLIIIINKQYK